MKNAETNSNDAEIERGTTAAEREFDPAKTKLDRTAIRAAQEQLPGLVNQIIGDSLA